MTSQVGLTFIMRLARLLAGIGAGIVTARALGPAGRGDYFLITTISSVIVQFGNLGLASSNTYLVAQRPSLFGPLLNNTIVVSALAGILGAAVVASLEVAGIFSIAPGLLWPIVALAPITLFYLLGSNLLVGIGRITAYNLVEGAATVMVTAAIVAAAIVWATPLAVLISSAVGWGLAAAVLLLVLRPAQQARPQFDRAVFRAAWRFAAKAYAITLLGALVLRANVFVLERLSGSAALGQFSIASQIAEAIAVFPASVALVLFPRLIREAAQSWGITLRTMLVVGLALSAACGLVAVLSDPLVQIAFGAEFAPAAEALRILLPGVVSLGMLTVMSQFLGSIGLPVALVGAWLAALALVVTLGITLVPLGAASGAAAALSLTYAGLLVVVVVIGVRYSRQT